MAELSELEKREIIDFFEENKRLNGVCVNVEESFRAVIAEIWAQAKRANQMQEEIEELKRENERLKTSVDMTKPQPCAKFDDAIMVEWIAKLSEETDEVIQEAVKCWVDEYYGCADSEAVAAAQDCLAMEITDVKTLCESWLCAMGYDEEARGNLQKRVNEKNKKRGYF